MNDDHDPTGALRDSFRRAALRRRFPHLDESRVASEALAAHNAKMAETTARLRVHAEERLAVWGVSLRNGKFTVPR